MPSAFGFAHLWQQEELADIDLVLSTPAAQGPSVLRSIPAHRVILTNSAFLRAQMLRWSSKACCQLNHTCNSSPTVSCQTQSTPATPAAHSTDLSSASASSSSPVEAPSTPEQPKPLEDPHSQNRHGDKAAASTEQPAPVHISTSSCSNRSSDSNRDSDSSSTTANHICYDTDAAVTACPVLTDHKPAVISTSSKEPPSSSRYNTSNRCTCPACGFTGITYSPRSFDSTSSSSSSSTRQQVVLTLQHADQEPAAMAVLEALYGVKPLPELLSALSQEQLLQAALLADMWQLPPEVGAAAVQLLVEAASNKDEGLSAAVITDFLQLEAHPACLLPLLTHVAKACLAADATSNQRPALKRVLLTVLGDLEEVWSDAALQKTLLGLPLPAMMLLLSCDELKVATEDTVLFTAQAYINHITDKTQQLEVKQRLAHLVRCPYLSTYWLSASVVSTSAPDLVLTELDTHLRWLLMLKLADAAYELQPGEVQNLLPGAPESWALGRRVRREVVSVSLLWELDVSALREAAQRAAAQQQRVKLYSSNATGPLGGLTWRLEVACAWSAAEKGVKLGLFASVTNALAGAFIRFKCSMHVEGGRGNSWNGAATTSEMLPPDGACHGWGWHNFFGLGFMAGGWDEAAWAAQGYPTSGQLKFRLTVAGVGHSS